MAAFAVLFALLALGVAGGLIWVLNVAADAPALSSLKPQDDGANSQIFDADGNRLGYVQTDVLRDPIPMKKIPQNVQDATIAIEDASFYEHGGVDYPAIARAAIADLEAGGEARQGASTITQQLVRNLYIEDPEQTITRKIQEAKLAQEYEDKHSKTQILNQYLNTAPYGTNDGRSAIGVEAASEVYFNKHAKDLTMEQAALLAGLPQAPSEYNPFTDTHAARDRRDEVLDALAKNGYITQQKADKLKKKPLELDAGDRYYVRKQQYFFDYVQQELIDRYGVNTVRQGGLKVYTTLDPQLQATAEQAIANHPVGGVDAAHALVSINADNGDIVAMASDSTYDTSQYNLAVDGERQPGSSFKTFVLTTAVDQGMDPASTTYPAPATMTLQIPYGPPWTVSGEGGGNMNLDTALAHSINTVFAQLGLDVGPENFDAMAHKLGVTSKLQAVPAEAIGGTAYCCTVLEMADAYATLANGGIHHKPTAIKEVKFPDGKVDKPDTEGDRVISDGVAYTVDQALKGPLEYGTAAGQGIQCPAGGKTGTTELQSDAWFVGITPHISTAVWTGNPNIREPLPGYGADLSAPIWHDYMTVAAAKPCDDFPAPSQPANLSSYSAGDYAIGDTTSSTDSTGYATTTTPTTTTPAAPAPDAYAPGIQPGGTKAK